MDGYGIRSTIFLKGCPLRCLWCCNPEGQKPQIELKEIEAKCNGCGRCADVCPKHAITVETDPIRLKVDRSQCDNCLKCNEVCTAGALDKFGTKMTAREAFEALKKGAAYYKRSGGGITIGGGECTTAAEFTYSLMKMCQAEGIHTAIDSCGYTVSEDALQILKEADLVLYDFKGADREEHIRNTGVSNKRILANLHTLDELGIPVIIRMPLIPGYNDSEENIRFALELFLKTKSIERIDILAYHQYGVAKHNELGIKYLVREIPRELPGQRAGEVKKLFEEHGLKVQLGG